MKCEIVTQWVGNRENTFFVCRTHKIECESESCCPKTMAASSLRKAPEEVEKKLLPGTILRCTKLPVVGTWTVGHNYVSTYEQCDNYGHAVGVRDDNNTFVVFDQSDVWKDYFKLQST